MPSRVLIVDELPARKDPIVSADDPVRVNAAKATARLRCDRLFHRHWTRIGVTMRPDRDAIVEKALSVVQRERLWKSPS